MRIRHLVRLPAVVVVFTGALLSAPLDVPSASADPCPDVEVVFARGTNEAPPFGPIGDAFVSALRSQIGPRTFRAYGVNYPATTDFHTGVDGVLDAAAHIRSTVATCPKTQLVLGGFSQGAAVMAFVTAEVAPDGLPSDILAVNALDPMSPEVADHVAAVVLFGKPSPRFMRVIGMPPAIVSPLYASKGIELCAPNDAICSDQGLDLGPHGMYPDNGLAFEGAAFAAGRLPRVEPRPASPPPSSPAATAVSAPQRPAAPPQPAPPPNNPVPTTAAGPPPAAPAPSGQAPTGTGPAPQKCWSTMRTGAAVAVPC